MNLVCLPVKAWKICKKKTKHFSRVSVSDLQPYTDATQRERWVEFYKIGGVNNEKLGSLWEKACINEFNKNKKSISTIWSLQ